MCVLNFDSVIKKCNSNDGDKNLKHEVIVYEGALCCPSGVCGPEPDKTIINFNEMIRNLADNEQINITRVSMSFDMDRFLQEPLIFGRIRENGPAVLPITMVDGKIILEKKYPVLDDLQHFFGQEK